jgi:excisionase family DNA binding protein
MNVNFENLEKIEEILTLVVELRNMKMNEIKKRWLTTDELSDYIGYSKETISKKVKDGEFELDKHYYKPERKLMFDKNAIDKWIMGIDDGAQFESVNNIVNNVLGEVA